jgi:hypothetical protein
MPVPDGWLHLGPGAPESAADSARTDRRRQTTMGEHAVPHLVAHARPKGYHPTILQLGLQLAVEAGRPLLHQWSARCPHPQPRAGCAGKVVRR